MNTQIKLKISLTLVISLMAASVLSAAEDPVPYPEALDNAAVIQTSIDDINKKAIVIGNGDINGLVHSSGDDIVLTMTKNDVWDCRMNTSHDQPLPSINVKEHTWTGEMGAPPSWKDYKYPTQVSFCDIRVSAGKGITSATLDLRQATAEISAIPGITRIQALWQCNLFLIETPGEVTLEEHPWEFLPPAESGTTDDVKWLRQLFPGDDDYKGMEVIVVLKEDGNHKAIAVVSSYDSTKPMADAVRMVKKVLNSGAETAILNHEKSWEKFWSTSGVALADKNFQNWWYRQLYYFRCFSSPGVIAMGLQAGVGSLAGWHGSYKINYNIWQTFWTPFTYNHPDLVKPWVEHLYKLLPRARWFAEAGYGCEGAAFFSDTWPHEVDPSKCSSNNRHQIAYLPWGYTMGMSGMAIQNLWNHYLYKPDKKYLKARIYPVIKEVALFYCSFIEQCQLDESGNAIIGPSYNPEHGLFGTDDNPYDLAYVRYTLNAAIRSAQILNLDKDLVNRFKRNLAIVPPYHTAPDPEQDNQPVIADWRGASAASVKMYNIVVPVVPLFPGDQFSWFSQDEEKELCRRSIYHVQNRYNHNNSDVIINVARARLSMTGDALQATRSWYKKHEQPNGLFYQQGHGFYMSEQTAVGALINEFLLQSIGDIIRVFPSWSEDSDASFKGLRAQGGFLVSAEQCGGKTTRLEITSTVGGKLRLLSPWATIKVRANKGETALKADARDVVEIETEAGERLAFFAD